MTNKEEKEQQKKKRSKKRSLRPSATTPDPPAKNRHAKNKKDKKKHRERRSKNKTSDSANEKKERRSKNKTSDSGNEKKERRDKKKKKADLKRQIPTNSTIETSSSSYSITKKLGAGGFGDVYEVLCLKTNKVYAVKVEYVKKGGDRRLKKEYEVYREITRAKRQNSPKANHLMEVIDYGEVAGLMNFMFMPLCGQSLDMFTKRNQAPPTDTAIILAEQTLRAIQNFHSFKQIHRDIKPANFVVGLPPDNNTVFLIDFGMAVRYCVNPEKMPKTSVYDFIGTMRYASRTTHQGNVQSRKDDLESWMYVAMEFFDIDALCWSYNKNEKVVHQMKEVLFEEESSEVFSRLPSCFVQIAGIINAIKPLERPKYKAIHEILLKLAQENGTAIDGPLRGLGPKVTTPSRKAETPTQEPADSKPESFVSTAPFQISPLMDVQQAKPKRTPDRKFSRLSVSDVLPDITQNNTVDATTLEEDSDSSSSVQTPAQSNYLDPKMASMSPMSPYRKA